MSRTTSVSQVVGAPPQAVYDAFRNPDPLLRWLPPDGITGRIHAFDGCVGGGYRMSLYYPDSERTCRGKTADREDLVQVRSIEPVPPRRCRGRHLRSRRTPLRRRDDDHVSFAPVGDGTEVTFLCENLPPALLPENNEAGSRLSLERLARLFA